MKKCIVALTLLCACQSPATSIDGTQNSSAGVSQKVANVVSLCSSGSTIKKSVQSELTISLQEILTGSGSASAKASIESSIRGIVFEGKDFDDPNTVKALQIYSECVTTNLNLV